MIALFIIKTCKLNKTCLFLCTIIISVINFIRVREILLVIKIIVLLLAVFFVVFIIIFIFY